MGSAPTPTSTKSTQTDGKFHVSPALNLAYASIASALDTPPLKPPKKKQSSDLMLMLDDIDQHNSDSTRILANTRSKKNATKNSTEPIVKWICLLFHNSSASRWIETYSWFIIIFIGI